MSLEKKYPKLFNQLEDRDVELRHLLSVDENYEDYDSEEFEFNFEEYNFVIYIAEPIQKALGEEKMMEFNNRLSKNSAFSNFIISEDDLYGAKSELTEDEIVQLILNLVEEIV